MRRGWIYELLIGLGLLILPLLFFWPVIFGGKTLIPFDNLYAFEPWKSYATQLGVGIPHNLLLSDLLLENYAWKEFVLEALRSRQVPFWNPYLFAGAPFLAAGQHSALYPLSIIYYIFPLSQAYGYFTVLHLFLAGLFIYIYGRVLGLNRWGALLAGVTYTFSLFMVVRVVWPQTIAAVTWLPLILALVELAFRAQEGEPPKSPLPYLLGGALVLGVNFLAGHAEFSYLVLLATGFYTLCRLVSLWRRVRDLRRTLYLGLGVLAMAILGLGLGGIQLLPLYELVTRSFRQDSAGYQEIIGWAYPKRQIITFLVPNFFGNPAHHGYFDLLSRKIVPVTQNFAGEPIDTIFWGIKNYVEAGSYVGIVPLLLAVVALFGRRTRFFWIFASLALLSLLFAFGTPLYALLFYILPGYRQLHTPFRWVFPYTLSIALLAGLGADHLAKRGKSPRLIGWLALSLGCLGLLLTTLIFLRPDPFIPLADHLLTASQKAQEAFANGSVLLSYEWPNLVHLALFSAGGGLTIVLAYLTLGRRIWQPLALFVLLCDLFIIGRGFNPAVDPELIDFTPPSIAFLQSDPDLFRFTTFNAPGEKTFHANAGMFYGLSDIRGYDSIIPQQYAQFMGLIEEQGELLYNRIAPLYKYRSLDSPLLDLLNVKYVVTTQHIPNPGYTLVYDDEVRIYRNNDYLPRAFLIPDGVGAVEVISDRDGLLQKLREFNPREVLLLEEEPKEAYPFSARSVLFLEFQLAISKYSPNEVVVEAHNPEPAWLVLADSYFPGWKAYLSTDGSPEEELHIYKADYNFRAVHLPPGSHLIRFKYSPLSFKLGLYVTFLAGVITLVGFGYSLWGHMYREEPKTTIQRVLKNALTPMGTSFLNKGIDTAFAMVMLRILGPEGQGKYGFAIFIVGYFEIVTNFGLDTLLTREVAKDPSQGNRYLSNTAILRLLILLGVLPLLFIFLAVWRGLFALSWDTIVAILLLTLSLIPSSISAALSSLFRAHEKMEYPAAITMVSTILKVTLGLLALLLGFGFVGLAGVSVMVNLVTMLILLYLVVKIFFRPQLEFNPPFSKEMLGLSYPLMINHLLATLFFRVDVTLLQPMKGDTVVGWYTAAYKFIDGVNIIPSTFTIAIFPIISRFAQGARESLIKAYTLAIKALLIVSLPLALLVTFYARGLILIFGGSEYLPHSAIALSLLIWYAPVGFINSVTQYLLIAINQQRFLTRAFLIGLAFNIVANLIFIPSYGYQAAAVITILSEIALFLPFYYGVRKHLTSIPWLGLAWRPTLSTLFMGAFLLWFRGLNFLLLAPSSLLLYLATLVALGTFEREEIAIIRELLPLGRQPPEEGAAPR
ncbi:MAG: oligosaccharide flippase family protein [Anaerolineae bacterium]